VFSAAKLMAGRIALPYFTSFYFFSS